MPGKSIPLPDNYIVWRDNRGQYHVAKRPPDIHPPMPSRTRAVQWLWGEFGRVYKQPQPSSGLEPGNHTVWHTHFGTVADNYERMGPEHPETEEEHTHDPAEQPEPTH